MKPLASPWPSELLLVRHGESVGNVARNIALQTGAATIAIGTAESEVPLSPTGESQCVALGEWLGANAAEPAAVVASPFLRARATAEIVTRAAHWDDVHIVTDERLREKELGLLDRLTSIGIQAQYPQEVSSRARLGKFYYRPPRGESWADVVLRLRSALEDIRSNYGGQRVLIVTHQVVILCLRYIIEQLGEQQLLEIDRAAEVANCSLTTYRTTTPNGPPSLIRYNFVAPLESAGAPVTSNPDATKF